MTINGIRSAIRSADQVLRETTLFRLFTASYSVKSQPGSKKDVDLRVALHDEKAATKLTRESAYRGQRFILTKAAPIFISACNLLETGTSRLL
jgi:hypothetical protein